MSWGEKRGYGRGDSKGRRLYQESVKWRLTRFIKSASEAPEATKVTNQVVAEQRREKREYTSEPTNLGYSSLAAPGSYCVTREGHLSMRIPPTEKEERMDSELVMDELRIAGLDNNLKTIGKHFWNGH